MDSSSPLKRKYSSTRRQSQARQTRRLILEAAHKLFDERGYSSATIEAIAEEAGVAPETIYAIFGNKIAVLKALVHLSVVGDDKPGSLLERPFIQRSVQSEDQRAVVRHFAENIYQIMTRMSPIFALLRATAKADAEIAALQDQILKDRLDGMGFFVAQLVRTGPLRTHPDQARVTAWALSSAEVFDLLTRNQGWSQDEYIAWLEDSISRLLLE